MSHEPKSLALGRVLADFVAYQIGSWRFVAWQSSAIVVWIAWNLYAPEAWRIDPPPFIGLNLLLSLQAAYTGPVLLISANRQSEEDRKLLRKIAAAVHPEHRSH